MSDREDLEALDRAVAGVESRGEITGWECRKCGALFESGREARRHLADHEDGHRGLKIRREGE